MRGSTPTGTAPHGPTLTAPGPTAKWRHRGGRGKGARVEWEDGPGVYPAASRVELGVECRLCIGRGRAPAWLRAYLAEHGGRPDIAKEDENL